VILSSSEGICVSSGRTADQLPERGECPASPLLPSPPNNNPTSGSYNGIVYSNNYHQSTPFPTTNVYLSIPWKSRRIKLETCQNLPHDPFPRPLLPPPNTSTPPVPSKVGYSSNGFTNRPPMRNAANLSGAAVETSSTAVMAFLRRRISVRRAVSEMRR